MAVTYNEQLLELVSNAQMAFFNGQYHEAFNLAKEAIKLDENCADAYQCAANVCMSLNRYDDAIEYYSQAVRCEPDNGNRYFNLGYAQASVNKIADAVFTIPMGFKGAVVAEVVDNVEHTSGLINADGSIIEDETIHSSTSSINIAEDVNITKVDNDNTLLFNQSIPLTISVKDTFSGISTIEWSIANDGESGIITVANDGKCDSNSSAATIGEVETESNLVTSMQFTLSVDDNSNGNVVLIKLTDHSGNTSEVSKAYSVDTTVPTISASLSNQTPHNTMYYNTDQTVTISITERNFNASDVHFMLNGSEQIIGNWSTSGNGDSAVHTGIFTISTDGDYSYSISYSDMAGNMAEVFTQSMFVVDKTSPVIKTNFDEFKTEQEKHYFGLDSINKTAKITITEHNFSAKDANVEIFRLEPGSKHDVSGIESTTVSGWSDNGDEHTLEIPFEDGDDGVYTQ